MDINSLLSPQDSPVLQAEAPKRPIESLRRDVLSSSQSPARTSSTRTTASLPPTSSTPNAINQAQTARPSPKSISPTGRVNRATSTPSADTRTNTARTSSTAGMDTLADLASMQHHQHAARASANSLRSTEIYESRSLPRSPSFPAINSTPNIRAPNASTDLTMADVPRPPLSPRNFVSASLSDSELERIAELTNHLAESPNAHESHVQLINLLHEGFVKFVGTPEQGESHTNPQEYELLRDLRQAREAFHDRYAVGEEIWLGWISDEIILAGDIEEKVELMELVPKALEEESRSAKLWAMYGNWMYSVYSACHPERVHSDSTTTWNEEEVALGKELFGWSTMIDVWKQAAAATKWRIDESDQVWDKFIDILIEDLEFTRTQQKIGYIKTLFADRLQTPHAKWDQTFQTYSTFITRFDNSSYEDTMVNVNRRAAEAKSLYAAREPFELRIKSVEVSGSKEDEWSAYSDYLEWETTQSRKKLNMTLCISLYYRALLRFGINPSLWEEFILFVKGKSYQDPSKNTDILPILARATRHCPWSGSLWSQYLLAAETSAKPFQEIEEIKHKATSTGLLDAGGMDEVLKVHSTWCGFLKRRAFHDKATDEELDVAEVGIRSALESVKQLGEAKFGEEYKGDPLYRLERIYVQYLSLSGQWENAREVWKSLVPIGGTSYEFWIRWYHWEMICWAKLTGPQRTIQPPTQATQVLRQALKRFDLDWPEKVSAKYLDHVEDYENADELLQATTIVRKYMKSITTKREKEASEAVLLAREQMLALEQNQRLQDVSQEQDTTAQDAKSLGKRKRETDESVENGNTKKSRPEEESLQRENDQYSPKAVPAASIPKRDRENNSVIVENLPANTTEVKVRQFFRDCGTINTIKIVPKDDGQVASATIEFASQEDVLSAKTKDMKPFEGNLITVQTRTGSTVYVTNFSPIADETSIRELFAESGKIIDVRFPSLKYNSKRRFCYVQFEDPAQADSALKLVGKEIDGYALEVKISDPSLKQGRSGALYEGREIHVSNLDWSGTEDEILEMFSKYGNVEKVKLLRTVDGRSKGTAFVVFTSKDEANAALDMNMTKFKSRVLGVELATTNPEKKHALPRSVKVEGQSNGRLRSSTTPQAGDSNASKTPEPHRPTREELARRTIALVNIPDTVNESRIRAVVDPYGPLVKILLRPDHQGAIVEFKEANDAGKAALGVIGHEIVPGRALRVVTVQELKKERGEYRNDKIVVGKQPQPAGTSSKKAGLGLQPTSISRPAQPGARRGGKGGLGLRRGGAGLSGPRASNGVKMPEINGDVEQARDGAGKEKSNADFREMFLK